MKRYTIEFDDAGKGSVSDGYHTFDELYDHRCLLFVLLCLTDPGRAAWRPDFEGWFVLYLELLEGQISYHISDRYLNLVEHKIRRDDQHVYDGHTSPIVLGRLEACCHRFNRTSVICPPHEWDDDQYACRRCGSKEWMT